MTDPARARIGVLLVNLGTPDTAEPAAVRRYLAEFLSDRRVVEIPPLAWQPILRGIILNARPRKSAHAYRLIWDQARDGSPLRLITEDQAAALAGRFGPDVIVDHAMRYGQPAIGARLAALQAAGCERILVAPLYPQYCAATTATVVDAVGRTLAAMRRQPAIRTLPPYHADPAYIGALAADVGAAIAALPEAPDAVLATFHGMPERTRTLGDPYHDQCLDTARLVGVAMGREIMVSFQSRFGRAKWLEPATDAVLAALPGRGIRRLAVFAPGFSADCLETLEEIAIRGRDIFLKAGGERFDYLPCLNARPAGVELLQSLLSRELEGWI